MTFELHHGDALEVLRGLPAASADALVTDPPAGISFMGAGWDGDKGGRIAWITWLASVMREALRVLKPGAHGLVWALPRTSHWTGTALENAGFDVRDRVTHLFGQGFPKSKNLDGAWQGWGTALKPAAEDWWLVRAPMRGSVAKNVAEHGTGALNIDGCRIAAPAGDRTDYHLSGDERSGMGFMGAALGARPAYERPALGRWPANVVLSHLPECERVGTKRVRGANAPGRGSRGEGERAVGFSDAAGKSARMPMYTDPSAYGMETVEAWHCAPGCAVAALDEQSGRLETHAGTVRQHHAGLGYGGGAGSTRAVAADAGGASRFFYCSKASTLERTENVGENDHETVKPLELMRYYCRLITPPGGTILDCFAGSGTTGVAALQEGFRFVGIEREAEYVELARRRIANALGPLFAAAVGGTP